MENSPEALPIQRCPTLTGKVTVTIKSLPSRLLFRRDLVSPVLSGKFLDPVGTHQVCQPGYQAKDAKFTSFPQGPLNWCGLATA